MYGIDVKKGAKTDTVSIFSFFLSLSLVHWNEFGEGENDVENFYAVYYYVGMPWIYIHIHVIK